MSKLTSIIKKVTNRYLKEHDFPNSAYINSGLCSEFANDVKQEATKRRLSGVQVMSDSAGWLHNNINHPDELDHSFLYYQGKYYDSESPNGVDKLDNLHVFLRQLRK